MKIVNIHSNNPKLYNKPTVKAKTQLMAINEVLNLEIRAYDISEETPNKFIDGIKKITNIRVIRCRTAEECVKNADIISTQTPAIYPVLNNNWIQMGTYKCYRR